MHAIFYSIDLYSDQIGVYLVKKFNTTRVFVERVAVTLIIVVYNGELSGNSTSVLYALSSLNNGISIALCPT